VIVDVRAHVRDGLEGRGAVLDVDTHHGNGTQAIFYERDDVLTVPVHADPNQFYPFYWGYASETGSGRGEGSNVNLPISVGAEDPEWLAAITRACTAVKQFGPEALVVALGLDSHADDPLKAMKVTNDGFQEAGRRIGQLKRPTVIVQEGGYLSPMLGQAARSFLTGFLHAT